MCLTHPSLPRFLKTSFETMSGLVCTCSLDGRWSCVSNYFRWLNKTDMKAGQEAVFQKRIRCDFNNPPVSSSYRRQTAWALKARAHAAHPGHRGAASQPGSHGPPPGRGAVPTRGHTTHPRAGAAAPAAGLHTTPPGQRSGACSWAHTAEEPARPAPAPDSGQNSAGRGKAALTRRGTLDQKKLLFSLHCHISQVCLSTARY